jgi:hypothetical protein
MNRLGQATSPSLDARAQSPQVDTGALWLFFSYARQTTVVSISTYGGLGPKAHPGAVQDYALLSFGRISFPSSCQPAIGQ